MQEENREQGIIIKVKNYSASDKLVTIITDAGKKITHIFKSIKSPRSKKAHAVDLCNLVGLKSKSGYSLGLVTDIKLIKEFDNLKKDHKSLFYIQALCELVDNLSYEEVENLGLYNDFLWLLNQPININYRYFVSAFILKHIQESGYMPEIPSFSNSLTISLSSVGLNEGSNGRSVSEEEYKVIKCILERDLSFSCRVKPSAETTGFLYTLSVSWYENLFEKKFASGELLKG